MGFLRRTEQEIHFTCVLSKTYFDNPILPSQISSKKTNLLDNLLAQNKNLLIFTPCNEISFEWKIIVT
jgi:hypothetical protein